jgi:hypothetical protein
MHNAVTVLITLLTSLAATSAAVTLKDVEALMKESQALRETAAKEKNSAGRLKKLQEFETSLNAALKAYEASSPAEGGEAEEKVVKFSFRFEPVFELSKKKFAKSDCAKARGRIELEDQSGKSEGSPLSANAEEALKWLELICR